MNFIKEAKAYKEEQQFEQHHSEEEEEEGMRGEEEEEEEEEEEREATTSSNSSEQTPFPCPSSSSSSPPLIYRNFLPHRFQEFLPPPPTPCLGSLHFSEKLDLPDLSLANNNDNSNNNIAGATTTCTSNIMMPIEKEHMFDKVVTPSDVGKLNRLVIPKQHAEKYFPLEPSNEKGMLLNFEDRNGKPWRFRYSFWNSSQSYVMTKGWSRFVKEKKLDAGDIVSFQRGAGEEGRHRLFIDWRRRRPNVNPNIVHYPYFPGHLEVHNQLKFRWGNQLLYSLPHLHNFPPSTRPQPPSPPLPPPHQFQYANLGSGYNVQPFHNYQFYGGGNVGSYYGRPSGGNQGDDVAPMVIDSVPVAHGRTVGKQLRLFGVNMDCPMVPSGSNSSVGGGEEIESHLVGRPTTHGLVSANSLMNLGGSSLQWQLPSGSWDGGSSGNGSGSSNSGSGVLPMENMRSLELSKKGKKSLSFDLDL